MSSSVVSGSDEVSVEGSDELLDHVCQPCERENERIEATGYCEQCCEYLCQTCVKYHRRLLKTKGHTILKPSEASTVKAAVKSKDPLTEACAKHEEEVIKYFCNDHAKLACSVCLSMDHRTCDASYIPDVSPGIKDSPELHQVRGDLHKLIATVADDEEKVKKKLDSVVKKYNKKEADVKAACADITAYVKEVEKRLLEEINATRDEDIEGAEKDVGAYEAWVSELGEILHGFDDKESSSKQNGLFIAMKQAQVRTTAIENDTKEYQEVFKPTEVAFEKDTVVKNLQTVIKDSLKIKRQREQNITATNFLGELNVKSTEDKKKCYIGGILGLPDGQLAVADINNAVVKLIDPESNTITARTYVSYVPYDLALVRSDRMAVTFGDVSKVMILKLYGLTEMKSFTLTGTCKGIASYLNNIYVVCQDPDSVQIITSMGAKLMEIPGSALLTMPTRTTIGGNGNIYVAHHIDHAVVEFAPDTTKRATHTIRELKRPLGITYNPDDGCLYVVGWMSNSLHKLTPEGNEMRSTTLYGVQDGIQHPVAVACKDNKLFVSFDCTTELANKIKIFKI